MREILFRGKRVDNGEWVEGYYVYDYKHNAHFIFTNEIGVCNAGFKPPRQAYCLESYEVIPETVSQFTGLTDKNGVKIFEGDIVEAYDEKFETFSDGDIEKGTLQVWEELVEETHYKGSVDWNISSFDINDEIGYFPLNWLATNNIEVIGNLFDNPELLENEVTE